MACLQEPDNPSLLRRAAAELNFVGPNWNKVADELMQRAETLQGNDIKRE